jgi:HK97 family phage major capsid protein
MKEYHYSSDELIDMHARIDGGKVWIMNSATYSWLRFQGLKDDSGKCLFVGPELSGYGRLLGSPISIIEFDHFGLARI